MQKTACSNKSEVVSTTVGSKRIITLNRPKALNALNLNMVRELYPIIKKWDISDDVSMIIIRGAGEKAFCAGGDVLAVTTSAKAAQAGDETARIHRDFFREEYQLNHLIGSLSKPYVALIDGITMGGGCGLSVNGRFRVATERTLLAMPETALGLFPDVGGSYFLSRLKSNLGIYLALTGYRLKGADAYHSGIATHYVDSASLPDLQETLLSLENPTEEIVDEAILSHQPSHVPLFSLAAELSAIRKTFHAKSVEEIISNLKLMDSAWSKEQVTTLQKMSPTSLKVTLQQLDRGARTSYAKVFTMEYRMTQRFMGSHDFHEGCRSILIDKDRNPRWKPATLSEVTEDYVDSFFLPLPHSQELIIHDD